MIRDRVVRLVRRVLFPVDLSEAVACPLALSTVAVSVTMVVARVVRVGAVAVGALPVGVMRVVAAGVVAVGVVPMAVMGASVLRPGVAVGVTVARVRVEGQVSGEPQALEGDRQREEERGRPAAGAHAGDLARRARCAHQSETVANRVGPVTGEAL